MIGNEGRKCREMIAPNVTIPHCVTVDVEHRLLNKQRWLKNDRNRLAPRPTNALGFNGDKLISRPVNRSGKNKAVQLREVMLDTLLAVGDNGKEKIANALGFNGDKLISRPVNRSGKNKAVQLREVMLDTLLAVGDNGKEKIATVIERSMRKRPGEIINLAAKLVPKDINVQQPVFAPLCVNINGMGQQPPSPENAAEGQLGAMVAPITIEGKTVEQPEAAS